MLCFPTPQRSSPAKLDARPQGLTQTQVLGRLKWPPRVAGGTKADVLTWPLPRGWSCVDPGSTPPPPHRASSWARALPPVTSPVGQSLPANVLWLQMSQERDSLSPVCHASIIKHHLLSENNGCPNPTPSGQVNSLVVDFLLVTPKPSLPKDNLLSLGCDSGHTLSPSCWFPP